MQKRNFIYCLFFILTGFAATAQNYESIKNSVILTQYKKAKEELDKAMININFTSKPEAYILKALVYGTLSMEDHTKNTPAGDHLANEADAAFKKYKELDPSMKLVDDLLYQNGPINLYSSFYSSGYSDYSSQKWDAAFEKLKKAVVYSDLLIEKKLLTALIDTNVLILAGITAEKSNHKVEAAGYYSRLADKKITGNGFESVYRFLVSHYFSKKDYVSFEKIKNTGKELYPNSEFFTYDKIDFAVGLETTLAGKIKILDEILAKDPDNFKGNEWMGEIIYRAFYPLANDEREPFDSVKFEHKMIYAFNKAGTLQPDSIDAFLYLGDHYFNKSEKIKGKNKNNKLDKEYAEAIANQRIPYEKAAQILAAKSELTIREKAQYRNLSGKIADIYMFKKNQAKGNALEFARYESEEKKWNDKYKSLN